LIALSSLHIRSTLGFSTLVLHQSSKTGYILVIDDDHDIATLMQKALQGDGFQVSAFTDPTRALEDFNVNCKDCSLILSDIRMPGMNGYELVKKAKEIDKQVKVVLMSAFEIDDNEFHNLLPDIKVDALLKKPFSIRELNDTIDIVGRGLR
jgi:DNA-binding response OmpR family regulator